MNIKLKYVAFVLISACLVTTAQTNNKKQAALDEVVQRIVLLSQFITSIQVDQAESIADNAALVNSDAYIAQMARIDELTEVREVTKKLMNRMIATDTSELASIADLEMRVDTAFAIGEDIYYGQSSLGEALSKIDIIDELPDLLNAPVAEVNPQLTDVAGSGDGLTTPIPNIYDEISRPKVYRAIFDDIHRVFRGSTTTPDGGGFGETNKDATPI